MDNMESLETEKLKKEYEVLLREKKELINIIKENVKLDYIIYKQTSFYKKFVLINSLSFMVLASFLIFFFMNIANK